MKNQKKLTVIIVAATLIPMFIAFWASGMFSMIGLGGIIGMLAFIALILGGIFYGSKFITNMTKPKTIENGVPATATVISCRQGNMKISLGVTEVYKLVIQVTITNSQGETWEATMEEMIPLTQIAVFQPGVSFSVLYDPNDKSKVVINQNAGGSQNTNSTGRTMDIPGYGTINSQMANAAKQVAPQDVTLLIMAQSALLKELTTTGVSTTATVISNHLVYSNYMNGADVYQLKLNVNAAETAPFEADITFLLGKPSVHKIEPGKTVFVKYDANNPARTCLTGLDTANSAVEL